jgi:hypothetical protein
MDNQSTVAISKKFVYWQCQIRKHSARELEYKPTSGICPELFLDDNSLGHVITLLVPNSPAHDVSHLQHVYNKTFDPKKRREGALKYLQSEFYQVTTEFEGELTVLAAKKAAWVDKAIRATAVKMVFEQNSKHWQVPCNVRKLTQVDMRWQFTLAHNQLFNHALTTDIQVLLFEPLWQTVKEKSLAID